MTRADTLSGVSNRALVYALASNHDRLDWAGIIAEIEREDALALEQTEVAK